MSSNDGVNAAAFNECKLRITKTLSFYRRKPEQKSHKGERYYRRYAEEIKRKGWIQQPNDDVLLIQFLYSELDKINQPVTGTALRVHRVTKRFFLE
jgi:hypothetical protein